MKTKETLNSHQDQLDLDRRAPIFELDRQLKIRSIFNGKNPRLTIYIIISTAFLIPRRSGDILPMDRRKAEMITKTSLRFNLFSLIFFFFPLFPSSVNVFYQIDSMTYENNIFLSKLWHDELLGKYWSLKDGRKFVSQCESFQYIHFSTSHSSPFCVRALGHEKNWQKSWWFFLIL